MAGLALALQLPTHIQTTFYTAALMESGHMLRRLLASRRLDEPDLKLAVDFGGQQIYENLQALPRAFVVGAAQTLEDETAVLADLPQIEPGSVALLSSPLPSP